MTEVLGNKHRHPQIIAQEPKQGSLMNCENCGNELAGNAIVCPACRHNNVRSAVSQWRARKTADLQDAPYGPTSSVAPSEQEEKLIQFPTSSRTSSYLTRPAQASALEPAMETAGLPAWRQQVKQKVRMVREKRQQELVDTPIRMEEAKPEINQNPIVESALRRIRRPENPVPAILARPARNSAQPVLWREDEEEKEPEAKPAGDHGTLPPIAPRAEERFHSPAPPTPKTQQLSKRPNDAAARQQARPVTRTLTARLNPFAPVSAPDPKEAKTAVKENDVKDSVLLTPRSWAAPAGEKKADEKPAEAGTPLEGETEVIGISHDTMELRLTRSSGPATLWLRTLAGACDFEIVATAYLPLFGAYATLNASYGLESLFVMAVLLAVCVFVYQLVMLLIAGRTFGMALLNLTLVNTDNVKMEVTRRQKMLRAWAATVAFLLLPLNYLVGRLNPPNRTLPDYFSGTTIIRR
jgi:hypothetical protein